MTSEAKRKYQREYMRYRRSKAEEEGICKRCIKADAASGKLLCEKCQDEVHKSK